MSKEQITWAEMHEMKTLSQVVGKLTNRQKAMIILAMELDAFTLELIISKFGTEYEEGMNKTMIAEWLDNYLPKDIDEDHLRKTTSHLMIKGLANKGGFDLGKTLSKITDEVK